MPITVCSFPAWNGEWSPVLLDHCRQSLSEILIPSYTPITIMQYSALGFDFFFFSGGGRLSFKKKKKA